MRDDFAIKADVVDALESVQAPGNKEDVVSAGIVGKVEVEAGNVRITLVFSPDVSKDERHALEDAVYDSIEKIEGMEDALVVPTSTSPAPAPSTGTPQSSSDAGPKKGLRIHGPGASEPAAAAGSGKAALNPAAGPGARGPAVPQQKALDGVKKVIAVASGKGGVGKSTVAVNLALALSKIGHSVGLLDIDIYGPSLPTLLGIKDRPAVRDRRIVPLEAEGLKLMSLGFLMEDDTPVIWRGPIVTGIIRQFLQDVDWKGLDYLIVDLPPGTGDAQLSLAQTVPVDGAVVVTTPSDLALIDAARGLQMFKTLDIPVIGIVENMSYHLWPGLAEANALLDGLEADGAAAEKVAALRAVIDANSKLFIFGEGGGRREAERLEVPLLGEIPLDGDVRAAGDAGQPIVIRDEDSSVTKAFLALATEVAKRASEDGADGRSVFSFMKS